MPTPYDADNTAERERTRSLVHSLDDEQLQRAANADWTIAGVLAHLAFWDARVVHHLGQWKKGQDLPAARDHVDWINDASRPLAHAIAPRAAADLAFTLAEEVDGQVAALPPELIEANQVAGDPVRLGRWQHRRAHLDEIELALAR